MPTTPEYASRLPRSHTPTSSTGSGSAHSSAMHPGSMSSSSHVPPSDWTSSMDSDWAPSNHPEWLSPEPSGTSWSAFSAGLCAGACAGAALALMFAPMRGSDMRNSVRNYASQGGERLSQLVESGRCLAEDALKQAAGVIEEGRRAFRTQADAASRSSSPSSWSSSPARGYESPEPLTASVAEIAGLDGRFEEPLGG